MTKIHRRPPSPFYARAAEEQGRETDGRFAHKRGSSPDVTLAPRATPMPDVHAEDARIRYPSKGPAVDKADLSPSDRERIGAFVKDNKVSVIGTGYSGAERQFFVNGKSISANGGAAYRGAEQAVQNIVVRARIHQNDDRAHLAEYRQAQEMFGDDFESIVNPTRSFWERVRGY